MSSIAKKIKDYRDEIFSFTEKKFNDLNFMMFACAALIIIFLFLI